MSRKKAVADVGSSSEEIETTPKPSQAEAAERAEQDAAGQPPRETASNHQPRQAGDQREFVPEPNPFQRAHNNVAGVKFFTRREPYQAELAFQEKPSQPVIDFLKANGFRWNPQEKLWTRPINFDTQSQDRLVASRTYHKVVEMILQEKGLAAEPDKTPF